ncbi:MAG: sugar phosphate isomerase/epimerase, partial [Deltaproteobacteria bacterium]
ILDKDNNRKGRPYMETTVHINVPFNMLKDRLDFAKEHRLNPEIYFNSNTLDGLRPDEVEWVSNSLRNGGLSVTVHCPYMDLNPGARDGRVKEITQLRLIKTLEVARYFSPKVVVCHTGYSRWHYDSKVITWLEGSLDTWEFLAQKAEELDIIIAIENVFEESPDILSRLFRDINSSRFKLCFDIGHCYLFSEIPVREWLGLLGEQIIEFHLHDNHGNEDEHLPIGEGDIDFDEFFSELNKFTRPPILTLEPHSEKLLWRSLEGLKGYL